MDRGLLGLSTLPFTGLNLTEPSGIVVYFGLINVLGRVVKYRAKRLAVGVPFGAFVVMAFIGAYWFPTSAVAPTSIPVIAAVSSIGGWISATGGAWKDAPTEVFSILKFLRSPILASLYGLLLASFTTRYMLFSLAGLGYTVATLETDKTFFFPSNPRGKFAGMSIRFPGMMERRNRFLPLYMSILVAVVVAVAVAIARPHHGANSLL